MLLHKECLPTQLQEATEQAVIAATFRDCDGVPLSPNTRLAKCSDIPTAAAPQTLTLSGQTLSISGGNSVTLPDQDTDAQQLSISGNVVSLTNGGSVTLPTTAAPAPQQLSIYNDILTLSGGGGSVQLPDLDMQTLDLQGNTLTISGGNSVTLPAGATPVFATPAEAQAGTSTTLHINPADLYARENIAAQTGVSNDPALVAAPTEEQSNWAVSLLGETMHYEPGVGWKVVATPYHQEVNYAPDPVSTGSGVLRGTYTAHRDGIVYLDMYVYGTSNGHQYSVVSAAVGIAGIATSGVAQNCDGYVNGSMQAHASRTLKVTKGQVLTFSSYHEQTLSGMQAARSSLTYIG